jgi:GntR family transcriptional repressor for pyruvate dehydrogenase complex
MVKTKSITPARRKNLYEEISNQIIELISDGKWREGERIPGEIELAGSFEVSRNSIRESIKALELIGILKAKSGSGTYVSDLAVNRIKQIKFSAPPEDEATLIDIMEARMVMEPGIVLIATKRADEKDFKRLHESLDACEKAFAEKNYDFQLGFSFHMAIFQISANPILIGIVETLKERLVAVRRKIFFKLIDHKVLLEELSEHKAILQNMENGDADEAARIMEYHIASSLARLKKVADKA